MDTGRERAGGGVEPQHKRKHPREWESDLNPEPLAGQDIGAAASEAERGVPTAYDRTEIHGRLGWLRDDELKRIPIVPEGQRLRQGARYLDLNDRRPSEFTATGDMRADRGHCFVPKEEVPRTIWNRLTGRERPGQEEEGEKPR